MTNLSFKGFKRMSLVEYPGKVCAIAFTGGCNFRCPWCYVKDLVLNYKLLPSTDPEWALRFMGERKGWLDAIDVTGGEPTINEGLPDFLRKAKKKGFLTGIETNGSNPDMINKLIRERLVNYIEMDVKAPLSDPKLYMKVVGQSQAGRLYAENKGREDKKGKEGNRKTQGIEGRDVISNIRKSIQILRKSKIGYAFRTTVVPTLLAENDVVLIAKELRGAKKYYIQQFKPMDSIIDARMRKITPYSSDALKEIKTKCGKYIKDVEIRGV